MKVLLGVFCLSVGLAVSLLPAANSAAAGCSEGDVPTMLQTRIAAGYAARDKGLILSAYADDAEIGTYIRGLVKKAELGEMLAADIALHKSMKADLNLENLVFSDGEAQAKLRLVLEGELQAGGGTRRGDTFYLKLRCREGWEIFLQTYLSDYSLPPASQQKMHQFQ